MSLPAEDYYTVITGLAGGLSYLILGIFMTYFAKTWPTIIFLKVTTLAKRAERIGLTSGNLKVIRAVGILFIILSVLILISAAQHFLWIQEIEPLS